MPTGVQSGDEKAVASRSPEPGQAAKPFSRALSNLRWWNNADCSRCGVVAQTRLLEPRAISHDRDPRTAWAVQIELWIICLQQPPLDHHPAVSEKERLSRVTWMSIKPGATIPRASIRSRAGAFTSIPTGATQMIRSSPTATSP